MKTTLKAGIVGAGFMGSTHSQMLRRLGIPIRGLAAGSLEEAESMAAEFGVEKAYPDFETMLADDEVDVVHICTPNNLHHPMAKAAMEAGKHVYCEKPLALTSDESSELLEVEADTGMVGAVNYNLRFYPLCQDARVRIQEGQLGEVKLVHGHYLQDWLFKKSDWNWRLDPEQGGSMRAVADIGSHWFDMITWLTGHHVVEVMADIATVIPTRLKPTSEVQTFAGKLEESKEAVEVEVETEDYASILFHLSNGASGAVTVSQVSAGHKNQFEWEVDGSKASFRWRQERPNELWIGHRDVPNEIMEKDPSLLTEEARWSAGFPGGHAEGYPDTFLQAFKTFYSYLEAGDFSADRQFPTFTDGHRENVLTDAVAQSAQERSWIKVPEHD